MQYLNATVFWNIRNNFRKLAYLFKYTLHDHFLEPIK